MSKAAKTFQKPINYSAFFATKPEEKRTALASIQVPKLKANTDLAVSSSPLNKENFDSDGFTKNHKPLKHAKASAEKPAPASRATDISPKPTGKGKRRMISEDDEYEKTTSPQIAAEKPKKRRGRAPAVSIMDQYEDDSDLEADLFEKVSPPKKRSKPAPKATLDQESSTVSGSKSHPIPKSPIEPLAAPAKKSKSRTEVASPQPSKSRATTPNSDGTDDVDALIHKIAKTTTVVAETVMTAKATEAEKAKAIELEQVIAELRSQASKDAAKLKLISQERESALKEAKESKEEVKELKQKLKAVEASQRSLETDLASLNDEMEERTKDYEAKLSHWEEQSEELVKKAKKYKQIAIEAGETARTMKSECKEWKLKAMKESEEDSGKERALEEQLHALQEQLASAQSANEQLLELTQVLEEQIEGMKAANTRLEVERDIAMDLTKRDNTELAKKLNAIESLQQELTLAHQRTKEFETKLILVQSEPRPYLAPEAPLEWRESSALGPFENFFNIQPDEVEHRWVVTCRNPKSHSELLFTLETLEDSIEYVPMDFKERNHAGDPSNLPDFLCRPIYFQPESLAPFLAKMITFLYRSK
jgi:hypothetical protein